MKGPSVTATHVTNGAMRANGMWVLALVLLAASPKPIDASLDHDAFHTADECVIAVGKDGLKVQGVCADGVAAFKGIPYAAPPIGRLRWQPPQNATATGLVDATAFKRGCNEAEDCL